MIQFFCVKEELVGKFVGSLLSMGVPDTSFLDLIDRVNYWISWGTSDLTSFSSEFEIPDNKRKMCCECELTLTDTCRKYHCQGCGRVLCGNCVWGFGSSGIVSGDMKSTVNAGVDIKSCKFCSDTSIRNERDRKYSDKIYPSESPPQSPEPPSPCFSGERLDGYSPGAMRSSISSFTGHPSPVSVRRSPSRYENSLCLLETFPDFKIFICR